MGDFHIEVPDAGVEHELESLPSQSSVTNLSFTMMDEKPKVPVRRRRSLGSDFETPKGQVQIPSSLEELRELFQGAGLLMIPLKTSEQALPTDEEELLVGTEHSSKEELQRAVKRLNTYRWFCRVPPVDIEEDEVELCECLSEALLLRQPVFLNESHLTARRISDLGEQLGGFMAKGDCTMMLHKESSLISAVDVGILCSHTAGWSYASSPPPGVDESSAAPGLQDEMLRRAGRHRSDWHAEHPEERGKGFATWFPMFSKTTEPVSLQNLPDSLTGFRSMWEISEKWMNDKAQEPKEAPKTPSPSPSGPSGSGACSPRRPWTNQSTRSRPGTVGTVGTMASSTSRQSPQESKPNGQRVRQVLWGSTEGAKRREWSRASNLSWGDRSKTVMLRRQLLNPRLQGIAGSRIGDTCILRGAPSVGHDTKEDEPNFVVFPPEGVCPLELLSGCHLPTWTIMPNSRCFQPSHALQVRMWRVRLLRARLPPPGGSRRASKYNSLWLPEDAPYDAIRLEELPLSFLTCDCSAEGNSFCILFRPQLLRLCEGDQLEVELRGLRGSNQRHHFFHEFRTCAELEWQDHEFFEKVQTFCELFGNIQPFQAALPPLHRSFSVPSSTVPDLRPLSHLTKEFKTDDIELSMFFYCAGVATFDACLRLQRSDGKIKVERATMVFNLHDRFLVRVLLPCSVSKYELAFRIATTQRPEKLVEHPLKYSIRSQESRSFPLTAVEDPPSQKYQRFGFCPVPAKAQLLGISICSPMEYGLQPGTLYFLVHVHRENLLEEAVPEPVGAPRATRLFEALRKEHQEAEFHALETQMILKKDPLFIEEMDPSEREDDLARRRSFQNTQRMMLHRPSSEAMDPSVNIMRRLHHGLECNLADRIQDLPMKMHLELVVREGRSNQQRFVQRLQRKLGHPEFFEGLLHLGDHDAGSKVELYYRITEDVSKAPLKIGEWNVGRLDALDDG